MSGLLFFKIHYYKSMKRLLLLLFVIVFFSPAGFSNDVDMPATGDLWDNWGAGKDFYGQDKPVTDEDFDKAIEQVKDKQNRNWLGIKKRNKNIPKGEEYNQSNESDILKTHTDKDSMPVVSLPINLKAGNELLPVGHYQVKAEKEGDNVVMKFYQAHYMMAQFPAVETEDDFGEEDILFAKWFVQNDSQIKVIYGSLDLNAYAVIDIAR